MKDTPHLPEHLQPQWVFRMRTQLRENPGRLLASAKGNQTVLLAKRKNQDEKVILDPLYLEALFEEIRQLRETLKLTADSWLYTKMLEVAPALTDRQIELLEETFQDRPQRKKGERKKPWLIKVRPTRKTAKKK